MPFTLAHPAAVLPFSGRRGLPLLPLAAGSVGPDLPYFLPERLGRSIPNGHTLYGAMTVSALGGLLLLAALVLLRAPLTQLLWGRHYVLVSRTLFAARSSWADWRITVPALYFGIATHIAWDSCTHSYGAPVHHLALLRAAVPVPGYRAVPAYAVLQWLSSVLGVAALVWWYLRRLRGVHTGDPARAVAWRAGLALVFAVAAAACGLLRAMSGAGISSVHNRVYVATTVAVAVFAVLWCGTGLLLRLLSGRDGPAQAG